MLLREQQPCYCFSTWAIIILNVILFLISFVNSEDSSPEDYTNDYDNVHTSRVKKHLNEFHSTAIPRNEKKIENMIYEEYNVDNEEKPFWEPDLTDVSERKFYFKNKGDYTDNYDTFQTSRVKKHLSEIHSTALSRNEKKNDNMIYEENNVDNEEKPFWEPDLTNVSKRKFYFKKKGDYADDYDTFQTSSLKKHLNEDDSTALSRNEKKIDNMIYEEYNFDNEEEPFWEPDVTDVSKKKLSFLKKETDKQNFKKQRSKKQRSKKQRSKKHRSKNQTFKKHIVSAKKKEEKIKMLTDRVLLKLKSAVKELTADILKVSNIKQVKQKKDTLESEKLLRSDITTPNEETETTTQPVTPGDPFHKLIESIANNIKTGHDTFIKKGGTYDFKVNVKKGWLLLKEFGKEVRAYLHDMFSFLRD